MRCEAVLPGVISPSIDWGRVEGQADRIAIVATGPSVEALDLDLLAAAANAGLHVIAINAAIGFLPVAHTWFTLDPSPANKELMRNRRPGVKYYAGVPDAYGTPQAYRETHREPAEAGVTYIKRVMGWPPLKAGLWNCPAAVRSGNSAFGGLGVAWHMKPRKIALLGVDGRREVGYAYGHGQPKARLWHLNRLFGTAVHQLKAVGIEVVNGNPVSAVRKFRRTTPNEAIEWIME